MKGGQEVYPDLVLILHSEGTGPLRPNSVFSRVCLREVAGPGLISGYDPAPVASADHDTAQVSVLVIKPPCPPLKGLKGARMDRLVRRMNEMRIKWNQIQINPQSLRMRETCNWSLDETADLQILAVDDVFNPVWTCWRSFKINLNV